MKRTTSTINTLFYILLALLPFNARHILNFQQINNLEGFREHLTWSIYFFDIVFAILLIIYSVNLISNLLRNKLSNNKLVIKNTLFYFILIVILSCLFAINKDIAFHSSAYLIGAILFFLIAKNLFKNKKVFLNSILIIFLSGVFQSIIAIFQFISQKSVGLYFMGESHLSPHFLGVAKLEISGEKFIRAYGTFPHPNLLGAFLILALICGLWLLKNNIYRSSYCHPSPCHPRQQSGDLGFPKSKLLTTFGNFFILIGIFLTFSRSVWLTTFLIILNLLIVNRKKIAETFSKLPPLKKIFSVVLLVLITFFILSITLPRLHLKNCLNDQSYNLRKIYNQTALKIIHENPILGVGSGNFTLALQKKVGTRLITSLRPWEIQPVHNLYLLIASEIGLIGLMIFIFFILKLFSIFPFYSTTNRRKTGVQHNLFAFLFLAYLFLGFFDHYFWTLPQGQMLFWLCLAFFSSSSRIKKITK